MKSGDVRVNGSSSAAAAQASKKQRFAWCFSMVLVAPIFL